MYGGRDVSVCAVQRAFSRWLTLCLLFLRVIVPFIELVSFSVVLHSRCSCVCASLCPVLSQTWFLPTGTGLPFTMYSWPFTSFWFFSVLSWSHFLSWYTGCTCTNIVCLSVFVDYIALISLTRYPQRQCFVPAVPWRHEKHVLHRYKSCAYLYL